MKKEVIKVKNLWKEFIIEREKCTSVFEKIFNKDKGKEVFTALKNISFNVKEGDTLGIIGPNGSGKSTLLKLIAGILKPSKGTIKTKGKIVSFLELGVGFNQELTARENVFLYGSIMGLNEKELKRKFEDIIKFAELERFKDTKLKNFSSGMQVRLAFSTAIQTNPDILLVDEVLAVGDMRFQQKCFNVFENYRKQGKTIVLVSHDLNAIRRFCNKTILLRDGEIIKSGNTQKVIDEYVYENQKIEEGKKQDGARWGNKKVIITNVKFLDKFNQESKRFLTGDPLTIRIFYNAKEEVKDPVFGIAIYHKDLLLFGINTMETGKKIKSIKERGFVDFKIKSLPFLEGEFKVTVAVHSRSHYHYDWRNKEFGFNVTRTFSNQGLLNIDGEWLIR